MPFSRFRAAIVALLLASLACRFFYEGMPAPVISASSESEVKTNLPPTGEAGETPVAGVPPTSLAAGAIPSPAVDMPPDYQPVFEPAPCAFTVPVGYSPECGFLVVPENRGDPAGRPVRLHTAIFRSLRAAPDPYPVVHLAGGPGSSSLEVARYLFSSGLDAVLETHDLVLFDQRGTGYSQPRLDCPERSDLTDRLLNGELTQDQEDAAIVDGFHRCRQRLLVEGVDLSAYTSAASAADLEDLRRALGYEQLNLYAVSYGSRLALTLARDFPSSVHSAVLDSTYPPEVHLYTSLAPNAQRAFSAFFARCAADSTCSGSYPHLETVFYAQVNRLNASPLRLSLWAGGEQRSVQVTGDLLIDVLFVGLYNPMVTVDMPAMIVELERGETAILEQRLTLYFEDTTALGMLMAVQCAEEIPFSPAESAYREARAVRPEIAAFFPHNIQPLFAVCQEWGPAALDPRENEPVVSDRPMLILAGELDPITPPEWGRQVSQTNPGAQFFEFPGLGHWVTRSSAEALSLALDFWNQAR